MIKCPECGHRMHKNGHRRRKSGWKQNYQCTSCKFNSTEINIDSKVESDKKVGEFNWREWNDHLVKRQVLESKSKWGQDAVNIKVNSKRIIYAPISDLHLGSSATNYSLFRDFTDMILDIDDLYISLHGDETDNFVNFRNKLAMHQQLLSPNQQDMFIESWLEEVNSKVLYGTWGNHADFEEMHTGKNSLKKIISKYIPYLDGIGIITLKVNGHEYNIATTHKTRWWSSLNKTHGLKRMAERTVQGCDIYIAGDRHDPSYEYSFNAGLWQVFIQLGTFKTEDSYSKKYFAYKTSPIMPCMILEGKHKEIIPFRKWKNAIEYI